MSKPVVTVGGIKQVNNVDPVYLGDLVSISGAPILEYFWNIVSTPQGRADLVGQNGDFADGFSKAANPAFYASLQGGYQVVLVVRNADGWSIPAIIPIQTTRSLAMETAADQVATWLGKYLERGEAKAGLTDGEVGYFFEDFTDLAQWQKLAGTANISAVVTDAGGVAEIATDAGDAVSYVNGDAVLGSPTVCEILGRWYVAVRMKLPAAPPADGTAQVGVFTGALAVMLGYRGGGSAAKYSLMVDSGGPLENLLSDVDVDAGWHDLEMWCDGSKYYLSVDGESVKSHTPALPPSGFAWPIINCFGGAGAGNKVHYDKYLAVFPQAV